MIKDILSIDKESAKEQQKLGQTTTLLDKSIK